MMVVVMMMMMMMMMMILIKIIIVVWHLSLNNRSQSQRFLSKHKTMAPHP